MAFAGLATFLHAFPWSVRQDACWMPPGQLCHATTRCILEDSQYTGWFGCVGHGDGTLEARQEKAVMRRPDQKTRLLMEVKSLDPSLSLWPWHGEETPRLNEMPSFLRCWREWRGSVMEVQPMRKLSTCWEGKQATSCCVGCSSLLMESLETCANNVLLLLVWPLCQTLEWNVLARLCVPRFFLVLLMVTSWRKSSCSRSRSRRNCPSRSRRSRSSSCSCSRTSRCRSRSSGSRSSMSTRSTRSTNSTRSSRRW